MHLGQIIDHFVDLTCPQKQDQIMGQNDGFQALFKGSEIIFKGYVGDCKGRIKGLERLGKLFARYARDGAFARGVDISNDEVINGAFEERFNKEIPELMGAGIAVKLENDRKLVFAPSAGYLE